MKNPSRNVMDFLSIYLFPFIWITFFKIYFKLKNDFYYFSMNTKYTDENQYKKTLNILIITIFYKDTPILMDTTKT